MSDVIIRDVKGEYGWLGNMSPHKISERSVKTLLA